MRVAAQNCWREPHQRRPPYSGKQVPLFFCHQDLFHKILNASLALSYSLTAAPTLICLIYQQYNMAGRDAESKMEYYVPNLPFLSKTAMTCRARCKAYHWHVDVVWVAWVVISTCSSFCSLGFSWKEKHHGLGRISICDCSISDEAPCLLTSVRHLHFLFSVPDKYIFCLDKPSHLH